MINAILSLFGDALAAPTGTKAPAEGFDRLLRGVIADNADEPSAAGLALRVADPDVAKLAPELRARLARVIARMREEYGHDVRVVEGRRSGARQDFLFAQGRERPGPVVTWTRDSEHERGRAVDLIVDDSYEQLDGYLTLQRVAREEGLHTLGLTDPGHLELPADVETDASTLRPAGDGSDRSRHTAARSGAMSAPGVAAVAAPAAVAQVAQPAAVARVAAPATAGAVRSRATTNEAAADGTRASASAGPRSVGGAGNGRSAGSAPMQADPGADGLRSAQQADLGAAARARGSRAAAGAAVDRTSVDATTAMRRVAMQLGRAGNDADGPDIGYRAAVLHAEVPTPERAATAASGRGGARGDGLIQGQSAAGTGTATAAPEEALANAGRSREATTARARVDRVQLGSTSSELRPGTAAGEAPAAQGRQGGQTGGGDASGFGSSGHRQDGHQPDSQTGGSSGDGRAATAFSPAAGGERRREARGRSGTGEGRPAAEAVRGASAPTTSGGEGLRAQPARPVQGPNAAGRIEMIDSIRDQVEAQPLRRVSLRVGEGADATRVRVDLRGADQVRADLSTESSRLAGHLEHDLPELTRALERRGVEVESLRVRHGERVVAEPVVQRSVDATRSADSGSSSRDSAGSQKQERDAREQPRRQRNQEGEE